MSLESILRIIYDMKSKVIDVESDMVDSSLPNVAVSDKELEEIEQECGIIFPEAYKLFLKNYGNGGFYLFGVEPMLGIGKNVTPNLNKYKNSAKIFAEKDEKKTVYIFPEKRKVSLKQLVPFTYGGALELSSDHWVFICDKEYENHNYPIGYITQSSEDIICVLDGFEKWLEIFWNGNKDKNHIYLPVIHLLYEDYKKRMELLDASHSELENIFQWNEKNISKSL